MATYGELLNEQHDIAAQIEAAVKDYDLPRVKALQARQQEIPGEMFQVRRSDLQAESDENERLAKEAIPLIAPAQSALNAAKKVLSAAQADVEEKTVEYNRAVAKPDHHRHVAASARDGIKELERAERSRLEHIVLASK